MDTIINFHNNIYTPIINDPIVLETCFSKQIDITESVTLKNVKSYLLNILLVLCNGRDAFRANLPNILNKYLINKIMEIDESIMVDNINDKEPFLFLKCNEKYVKGNLVSSESVGNVLGYPYTGPDWYSTEIDRYWINTLVIPIDMDSPNKITNHIYQYFQNSEYYFLYSSLCPVNKFDLTVKNNILQTIDKFNIIINNYGYKCIVLIHLYPKKSHPQVEINLFDELCE